MKKLIVIKFGGSVITDKKKETPTPNMKNINSLAKQLSQVSLGNRYKFIIVHGAGSYAHPLAKKYQLSKGMSTEEQKFGLTINKFNSSICLFIKAKPNFCSSVLIALDNWYFFARGCA